MNDIYEQLRSEFAFFTYRITRDGSLSVLRKMDSAFQNQIIREVLVNPTFMVHITFVSVDDTPISLLAGEFDFSLLGVDWVTIWLASKIFSYDLKMNYRTIKNKWFNYRAEDAYVVRSSNYAITMINDDDKHMSFISYSIPTLKILFPCAFFCYFIPPYLVQYYQKKKTYLACCIRDVPHRKKAFQRGVTQLEKQREALITMTPFVMEQEKKKNC